MTSAPSRLPPPATSANPPASISAGKIWLSFNLQVQLQLFLFQVLCYPNMRLTFDLKARHLYWSLDWKTVPPNTFAPQLNYVTYLHVQWSVFYSCSRIEEKDKLPQQHCGIREDSTERHHRWVCYLDMQHGEAFWSPYRFSLPFSWWKGQKNCNWVQMSQIVCSCRVYVFVEHCNVFLRS